MQKATLFVPGGILPTVNYSSGADCQLQLTKSIDKMLASVKIKRDWKKPNISSF